MAIVTKIIKAYTFKESIKYTQIGYPAQSKAIPLLVRKEKLLSANSAMSVAYQGLFSYQ
jgi:hypothetical protein